MALLVPNEGKVALADFMNGGPGVSGVSIGLYQNSPTIDQDLVLADVDECDFSGYVTGTLAMDPATLASNKGVLIANPPNAFTHDGGGPLQTVNGYYVFSSGLGVVLWIEEFAAPIDVENNGDEIEVTAKLTVDTE